MRRRRVIGLLVFAAAGVLVGGFAVRRERSRLKRAFNAWLRSGSRLERSPAGALAPETVRTLLVATDTLLARTPIAEDQHPRYAEFFRWHAVHVPGYRTLYSRFAAAADGASRRHGGRAFADADLATRRRVLDAIVPPHAPISRRDKLDAATAGRERWAFRVYVIEEILKLFRNTDAILQLGYSGWPGEPRGIDFYQKPLRPLPPA